jgi:hypothetical protein
MENKTSIKKKLIAVLMSAIVGFLFMDALILLDNAGDTLWGHGHTNESDQNFVMSLGLILLIPELYFREATGLKSSLVNAYTVDGLIGALIGVFIALFWQFLVKGDSEKSESKLPGNQMDGRQ